MFYLPHSSHLSETPLVCVLRPSKNGSQKALFFKNPKFPQRIHHKIFFKIFEIFFVSKDSLSIELWHPWTTTPYMHAYGTFCHFLFSKKKNLENFQNFRVLCLWVHILGVPVRPPKLQYVAYNIFQSHQKRSSRTKVMIDWKWVPKWPYLVAVFRGVFSRSVLWVFTGFKPFGEFWKKWPLGPIFRRS